MKEKDKQIEFRNKVLKGLEKAYERLLQYKKDKKSELVIMKGNKIVKVKP